MDDMGLFYTFYSDYTLYIAFNNGGVGNKSCFSKLTKEEKHLIKSK